MPQLSREHGDFTKKRSKWLRLSGWFVAFAIAAKSFAFSLSAALAAHAPAIVLRIDSGNPVATLVSNEPTTKDFLTPRPSLSVQHAAAAALASEPLSPGLLRQFALALPDSSGPSQRDHLFTLVERLSRRDVAAQLYLMSAAAKKGDMNGAIFHIDTVLRTRKETRSLGFMALTKGMTDPRFRTAANRILAGNPPWLTDFVIFAATDVPQPEWVVDVLDAIPHLPQSDDFDSASFQLMQRLADSGKSEALLKFYRKLPRFDPALLTSVSIPLDLKSAQLAPIAWHLIENSDFSAILLGSSQQSSNSLSVKVLAGKQGTVARKVVYLRPGGYQIAFDMAAVEGSPNVSLQVKCMRDNGVLMNLEQSPVRAGQVSGAFTIPSDCAAEWVTISVTNVDAATDASFEIRNISLRS